MLLKRRLTVLLAMAVILVAVFAGTAFAQGQAECGIGAVESQLATADGRVLGEGTSAAAHEGGVGSFVAPQAVGCRQGAP